MFEDFNQPKNQTPNQPPEPVAPLPGQSINPEKETINQILSEPTPTGAPFSSEPPKTSKRKYIMIGIIIFCIIAVLIGGAVVALNYLTTKNENANAVLNANIVANANVVKNVNVIANLNKNANANLNANANINAVANVNVNANANINANANANVNANINVNTNVNAPTLDSDNDGLTDAKELLYGTNPNNPDTDGDGHKDGAEIENLYSPNDSGRLSVNDFKTFCQNSITSSTSQPFSAEEIATVCNNGAEILNPILQLLIAKDTTGAQAKLNTLQTDVQNKCDGLFSGSSDKNWSCSLGLSVVIVGFGQTK